MKVLWLCNIMLPMIAERLHMEASNKEGWLSGLADAVLEHHRENGIALSVEFPVGRSFRTEAERSAANYNKASSKGRGGKENDKKAELQPEGIFKAVFPVKDTELVCYGFPEDVGHAEIYDKSLEESLKRILDDAAPDIVHCFGTEYPHTLAMCRIFPRKDRLLAGLQGLCTLCAKAYYANLPQKVVHFITLRDYLKRDSLVRQKEKFEKRGEMEREVIALAGNITGRTGWDRTFVEQLNSKGRYFHMNEILRPEFYESAWEAQRCIPHSIFLSQGDYPLKGLHYVLEALPRILAEYPDARVYVAGNSLVRCASLKEKLKLSAYGKYLIRLLGQNSLEDRVIFLGRLSAGQMRDRYLASHLYVCPSSLENSPNSLGEAMLLGMPCVSADVGGISSLFTQGRDGILYEGFRMEESGDNDGERNRISGRLSEAVLQMWGSPEKMREYGENAAKHAKATHDRDKNYRRLTEVYRTICGGAEDRAI